VCGRFIKPKQAYITSSGTFKGMDVEKLTMKCSNGANINQKMLTKNVMYLEAKN
jgi:hypothetical protein